MVTRNEEYENGVSSISKEYEKNAFNNQIQGLQGTKSKFMISSYLDKIVTNNKTNDNHLISVTYNEITSTEEDDIVSIKHSLKDNSQYEVSLDYDSDGYINKATIKDI